MPLSATSREIPQISGQIRAFGPAANGTYYVGSRNGVLRSTDGATLGARAEHGRLHVMIVRGSKEVFAYDDAHRILYASMFSGGVARMVVP